MLIATVIFLIILVVLTGGGAAMNAGHKQSRGDTHD